jgi:hypothetical protein
VARLRRLPKPTRRTRKQHRLTPQCEEVFAGVLAAADAPDADEEKAFAPGRGRLGTRHRQSSQ